MAHSRYNDYHAQPEGVAGLSLASGSTAWAFSSFFAGTILSGSANETGLALTSINVQHDIATTGAALDVTHETIIEIYTGEWDTLIAQVPFSWRIDSRANHSQISYTFIFPEPIKINPGLDIRVRIADSVAAALTYTGIKLTTRQEPERNKWHTTNALTYKRTKTHTTDALKTLGTAATTTNYPTTASSDDAQEVVSSGAMDITAQTPRVSGAYHVGWRFPSITVPQGTTITSAKLQMDSYSSSQDNFTGGFDGVTVKGQASDNAPAFTTTASDISNRAVTTATGEDTGPQTSGKWGSLTGGVDVTSIVQEIVNRAGWSSGNAIAILAKGNGTESDFVNVYHYDYFSGTQVCRLAITTTTTNTREMRRQHTTDSYKAVGVANFTKTHTTDTLKRAQVTKTHTTNALLRKASTNTHTTNALLKSVTIRTFTTNALLRAVLTRTHTADARFRVKETRLHTTDTLLRANRTKVHTADSVLRKTRTLTHSSDSYMRIGRFAVHTTDTVLRSSNTRTHTANTLLRATHQLTHTANALLRKLVALTHTTNTLLRRASTIAHTGDSLLRKANTKPHTTNALLRGQNTRSHTTDTFVLRRQALSHTTNALVRLQATKSHTADALLRGVATRSHTADALTRRNLTASHTADTLLRGRAALSHTTDGLLRGRYTRSHTVDASLTAGRTVNHSTNTLLRKATTLIHTTNTLLFRRLTATHTTNALLRARPTRTHTTDASLIRTNLRQHLTDALLKAVLAVSHITNALLRKVYTISHSTDTRPTGSGSKNHTTSAYLRERPFAPDKPRISIAPPVHVIQTAPPRPAITPRMMQTAVIAKVVAPMLSDTETDPTLVDDPVVLVDGSVDAGFSYASSQTKPAIRGREIKPRLHGRG